MKKNNKSLILLIGFVLIFIIFIIYYFANRNNSFNKYKNEKNKNLIYSIYDKDKTHVPHINVKGAGIEKLNSIIVDKANDFLKGDNIITYTFEINGKILSLAIQYVDAYDDSGYPKISYDVYNINFYNSTILSNEDMLNIFGITENDVLPIVKGKFGEYYVALNKKNIYRNECDFDGCFLQLRGIENDNYLEDIHYYIKNGHLYVIKAFDVYSIYEEEKYFTTNDFFIQITS